MATEISMKIKVDISLTFNVTNIQSLRVVHEIFCWKLAYIK